MNTWNNELYKIIDRQYDYILVTACQAATDQCLIRVGHRIIGLPLIGLYVYTIYQICTV
jgi:radical SAM superfamily enzyme